MRDESPRQRHIERTHSEVRKEMGVYMYSIYAYILKNKNMKLDSRQKRQRMWKHVETMRRRIRT